MDARRTGIAPKKHHPPHPPARLARPSLSPQGGSRKQVFGLVQGLLQSSVWATVASRVLPRACEGYRSCTNICKSDAAVFTAGACLPFCVRVWVVHRNFDWHVWHVHVGGGEAGLLEPQTGRRCLVLVGMMDSKVQQTNGQVCAIPGSEFWKSLCRQWLPDHADACCCRVFKTFAKLHPAKLTPADLPPTCLIETCM
jgi:hypothetical protein